MSFKPKRTPAAELARLVEAEVGDTVPRTLPPPPSPPAPARAEPTVQINFRGSKKLARLISELAEREGGSTRKLISRLLKEAGHEVPESDLNPPNPKRRYEEEAGHA